MKNSSRCSCFVACVLALLSFHVAEGRGFYFSTVTGSDSRSFREAQSAATPWKTFSAFQANSHLFGSGDTIFLHSGESFEGPLRIRSSGTAAFPFVITSYGSGSKPQISGLTRLTAWTRKENYWSSRTPISSRLSFLFLDGIPQLRGRFPNRSSPNGGYLTYTTIQDGTHVGGPPLPSSFEGGEVVIRKNRWVLDRNPILTQSGNILQYHSESDYPPQAGFGFFIQNHPATLDLQGEWFANSETGILLDDDPGLHTVQISTTDTLISIYGCSNIVMQNVAVMGANERGIFVLNSSDVRLTDLRLEYSGDAAVEVRNSSRFRLDHSFISHSLNNACVIEGSPDALLEYNEIRATGVVPGEGRGNSGSYEAVLAVGDGLDVRFNVIDSTGYIPITFRGSRIRIANNTITNYGLVKDDGAGIYTWNNVNPASEQADRIIEKNILLNGKGAGEGTGHPDYLPMHGIYLDDHTENVIVRGNVAASCNGYGLYIHNARKITVTRNVFFDNSIQLAVIEDQIVQDYSVRDLAVVENQFVAGRKEQLAALFNSRENDLPAMGMFDRNYYVQPWDRRPSINLIYHDGTNYHNLRLDLNGWRRFAMQDMNSSDADIHMKSYRILNVKSENKFSNGEFNQNTGGVYVFSAAGNADLSWTGSSPLTGGALSLRFRNAQPSGPVASIIIGMGAVRRGVHYLVRFERAGGSNDQDYSVFLRKSLSPYTDLSDRIQVPHAIRANEMVLQALEDAGDASLVFDIAQGPATFYLDHITIREAEVAEANPADSIRFLYNASTALVSASLEGKYREVSGSTQEGSVDLLPYSSKILFRTSGGVTLLPAKFLSFSGFTRDEGVELRWEVASNELASSFVVERSQDGVRFLTIGELAARGSTGYEAYRYVDTGSVAGRVYYRVRQLGREGREVYTSIILFSNQVGIAEADGLSIIPNPASDHIEVVFRTPILKPVNRMVIQSVEGRTLRMVDVISNQSVVVDISDLPAGIYLVVYYARDMVRKKFVKR